MTIHVGDKHTCGEHVIAKHGSKAMHGMSMMNAKMTEVKCTAHKANQHAGSLPHGKSYEYCGSKHDSNTWHTCTQRPKLIAKFSILSHAFLRVKVN